MSTALTPQNFRGKYPTSLSALTFVAGDATNGNNFPYTGREIVVAENTDGANPYELTLVSQPDEVTGRSGSVTYDIPAGGFTIIPKLAENGWVNGAGNVELTVENVAIKLAVVLI